MSETQDTFPLKCGKCNHEWSEHCPLPMSVDIFCKRSKAWACPKCGSNDARVNEKQLPPDYFAAEPEERKAIMEVEAEAEREAT